MPILLGHDVRTMTAYFGGPSLVAWKALCWSVGVTKSNDMGASGTKPLSPGEEGWYWASPEHAAIAAATAASLS